MEFLCTPSLTLHLLTSGEVQNEALGQSGVSEVSQYGRSSWSGIVIFYFYHPSVGFLEIPPGYLVNADVLYKQHPGCNKQTNNRSTNGTPPEPAG